MVEPWVRTLSLSLSLSMNREESVKRYTSSEGYLFLCHSVHLSPHFYPEAGILPLNRDARRTRTSWTQPFAFQGHSLIHQGTVASTVYHLSGPDTTRWPGILYVDALTVQALPHRKLHIMAVTVICNAWIILRAITTESPSIFTLFTIRLRLWEWTCLEFSTFPGGGLAVVVTVWWPFKAMNKVR